MLYIDYIKKIKKCPFCDEGTRRVLDENEYSYITYALAPYHKYHLLVVPKRHVENIKDLKWLEQISMTALLSKGIKGLDKLGHNDCSILVRDGIAPHKSLKHLHYHIIPGGIIEDISEGIQVRKLLTKKEENKLIDELNNVAGI